MYNTVIVKCIHSPYSVCCICSVALTALISYTSSSSPLLHKYLWFGIEALSFPKIHLNLSPLSELARLRSNTLHLSKTARTMTNKLIEHMIVTVALCPIKTLRKSQLYNIRTFFRNTLQPSTDTTALAKAFQRQKCLANFSVVLNYNSTWSLLHPLIVGLVLRKANMRIRIRI